MPDAADQEPMPTFGGGCGSFRDGMAFECLGDMAEEARWIKPGRAQLTACAIEIEISRDIDRINLDVGLIGEAVAQSHNLLNQIRCRQPVEVRHLGKTNIDQEVREELLTELALDAVGTAHELAR